MKKSVKVYVNKNSWIKNNFPFVITASYNNLVPVGDFQKLFSYGAGLRLNFSVKRFFVYNIRLGVETGFCYFFSNSDAAEKSMFLPVALALPYRFIIREKFTIEPGIWGGGAYNYLVSS